MGGVIKEMTGALFPGLGSERKGMSSLIRTDFKKYTGSVASDELSLQLKIYAVSASLWENNKKDYSFSLIAGHSLGFYTALYASGSIDFETGIYLISSAHNAISSVASNNGFGMTAIIGIKWDIIESFCKRYRDLYVANINSATQVVVSGAEEALELFEKNMQDKGALKISRLAIRHPLHTPILTGVSAEMMKAVKKIEIRPPAIPVVDHTTAEVLTTSEGIIKTLTDQFSRKVIWRDVINKMWGHGVSRFVEIGPGCTLSKLTKWIKRDAEVINLDVQT